MIVVGTKNKVKVNAVKELSAEYGFLRNMEVKEKEVESGVSEQPKSFEEIITGAINRAKNAFDKNAKISIGIEDGIAKIPYTKSGYMNFCVCAIYDGKTTSLGVSSGYEYPKKAIDIVFDKDTDINQAFYELGLTENKKIGNAEGAIAILTKNRIKRKDMVKQAVMMALIHLNNSGFYDK